MAEKLTFVGRSATGIVKATLQTIVANSVSVFARIEAFMVKKRRIAKAQLEALIMSEVAREPRCRGIIKGVEIIPVAVDGKSNWRAAFSRLGQAGTPMMAWTIARTLQTQYECSFD